MAQVAKNQPVKKSISKNANAPQLQTKSGNKITQVQPGANDPNGFAAYIAWCVACFLYPYQDGTNVAQDISDNAKANSDALALDINYYSTKLAAQYGATWTNVTPADVARLKTVGDLEKLVISHL